MAHVSDMSQLTRKDPAHIIHHGPQTTSSPLRGMNSFELGRDDDYCSEMLSLTSKIAALYVQVLPDSQAIASIDEVESLTTGLGPDGRLQFLRCRDRDAVLQLAV